MIIAFAFIAVTALRWSNSSAENGVGFLYVIPIILSAMVWGRAGGVVAVVLAVIVYSTWAVMVGDGLTPFGYALRVFVWLFGAITVGMLTQTYRREAGIARAVLEALPDPACVKGRDGKYLFANYALTRTFGVPEKWMENKPTGYGTGMSMLQRVIEADERVKRTRRPVELEVEHLLPDGQAAIYHTVKAPVLGPGGSVRAIVTIAYDISRRVEYERMMMSLSVKAKEEYDRARREYAQLVRHRLTNPLTIIHGATHTLQTSYADSAEQRSELADMIESALERIEELSLDPAPQTEEEYGLSGLADAVMDRVERDSQAYHSAIHEREGNGDWGEEDVAAGKGDPR